MVRSTTPTHIFTLPFSVDSINEIWITYSQANKIITERRKTDIEISGENNIVVTLTQQETRLFDDNVPADIQIKVLTHFGEVLASQIQRVSVDEILNDEVMS